MSIIIEILRRASKEAQPFRQSFLYEPENNSETAASALTRLNEQIQTNPRDINGNFAAPVRWERSCLQQKCGACAMVINGRPTLACAARLSEYGNKVRLEPLKKFPVVEDLIVDRSVMSENLKALKVWFDNSAQPGEKMSGAAYDASRCLQCGCCLEVCPNFMPGGIFAGMAAAVPLTRLLVELPASEAKDLSRLYRRHIFGGCGKSLACKNVCPAGIETDRMLVNSNAIAVWKSIFNRRKKGL